MAIKIPGIDTVTGLNLFDGDENNYLTVLRAWLANVPAVLDKLRNVSSETLANYAAAMHNLKGTCASIGAEELRAKARKLEEMAKAGDISGLQSENEAFLKQAEGALAEVKKWLDKN
ncbi:MAG: Hpt domain-containing protein [Treponema sp.]|jgi:HPt (histidine-containing phosphotransfer) domain-containing protein|nr:Hpt domain-containing protein [Treponema sp.]